MSDSVPPMTIRPPSMRTPRINVSDKVAVVVNGNAKRVTADVIEILDQLVHSGDLFVSRSLTEAAEIAEQIVTRGYRTVLTGGGDGTFVQMVTMIVGEARHQGKKPPRFGFLRLGTGNALAWVVGATQSKNGVIADLARLRTEAGSRPLRLLDVEGTLTPFAGLGVDAVILEQYGEVKAAMSKIPLLKRLSAGGFAYLVTIVGRTSPEYLFRDHPRVRVFNRGESATRMGADNRPMREFKKDELIFDGPARIVCASTIPYWGLGARAFPFADLREDRFHMRIGDITTTQMLGNMPALWSGTYRAENIHEILASHVSVEFEKAMPMQVGGDPVGYRERADIQLAEHPIELVDYYSPPPT